MNCDNCGEQASRYREIRRCHPCYLYRWRTGRERPRYLYDPRARVLCRACGRPARGAKTQLCHACYERGRRWLKRTRAMLAKINIKSTIATGTSLASCTGIARLDRELWHRGVANRVDVKHGYLNAN